MPHIKFASINTKYGNSGSCQMSVDYLSKENEGKELNGQEEFFNDKQDFIGKESARKTIDSAPKQGIRGDDAKYFEVIVSFDKNELKGKSDEQIKEYVKEKFPQVYADSVKGKEVDKDKLVWVAKLERERKYKGTDEEVKNGKAKSGEKKEGDQRHVHIIIARKTEDNKMGISPLTNYRKESKGVIKSGFDRNNFRNKSESEFDKKFNYDRPKEQSFNYLNTMKNGTDKEKSELNKEIKNDQEQNKKNQFKL